MKKKQPLPKGVYIFSQTLCLISVDASNDPVILEHTGKLGEIWNSAIAIYNDMLKRIAVIVQEDPKVAILIMPVLELFREMLASIVMYVE